MSNFDRWVRRAVVASLLVLADGDLGTAVALQDRQTEPASELEYVGFEVLESAGEENDAVEDSFWLARAQECATESNYCGLAGSEVEHGLTFLFLGDVIFWVTWMEPQ